MGLADLHNALARRAENPVPFEGTGGIDWADPDIGRRYLSYGRRTDEQTMQELAFIHRVIDMPDGVRVLDAMCGDGRIAIPLALTSCDVLGVDINPWVIEQARALADERELAQGLRLEVADLVHAPVAPADVHAWDVALLGYGMLSNFDRSTGLKLLERMRTYMRPGGTLMVEMNLGPQVIRELDGHQEWELSETGFLGTDNPALVLDEYITDPVTLTFVRRSYSVDMSNGEVQVFEQSGQFYDAEGLGSALAVAGFEVRDVYGDFESSPFEDALSSNLIAVATAI